MEEDKFLFIKYYDFFFKGCNFVVELYLTLSQHNTLFCKIALLLCANMEERMWTFSFLSH